ncbi:MAG: hypothetical protein U9M90_00335 [Patescibacteria group bacterium]|nr:hypothetical protein [Patescibacteria group bacterium]
MELSEALNRSQSVFKVKKGKLKYSQGKLNQYCRVGKCVVV